MATILRRWSYQYPWFYNTISRLAALSVGGEARFRQLAFKGLTLNQQTKILDLCCGGGQTTRFLVQSSANVTGLDASPKAIQRARKNVPQATYVEGFAEKLPFESNSFDIVHTSVALHEMSQTQLQQIFEQVYRVLKPDGYFVFIDLHAPQNPLFWLPLAVFMGLFETETAWELLDMDLVAKLTAIGFRDPEKRLYGGGSLQVVQVKK